MPALRFRFLPLAALWLCGVTVLAAPVSRRGKPAGGTSKPPTTAPTPAPVAPPVPAPPQTPEGEGDQIHPPPQIDWTAIAELPPPSGSGKAPGLAGTFAGAQGDVLMIAGGTNYPSGELWSGGTRAWHPDVYVLQRSYSPDQKTVYEWLPANASLPRSLAYGASAPLPDGVLCIGGAEKDNVMDTCFAMKWNAAEKTVEFEDYPKLPGPLACAGAARIGTTIYVLGGTGRMPGGKATNSFFALDLTKKGDAAAFVWQTLTPWDGPARIFPIAASSLENGVESLYLCGGRDPGGDPDFLTDLHRFDPVKKEWSILGDIVDPRGHPSSVMAAPAFHVAPHHLVIVSGTDEELVKMLENNERKIDAVGPDEDAARKKFNQLLLENYPGYTRTVMAYDAQAGEWSSIGHFPGPACLTTPAVNWDGAIIIPGGETGPGKRSATIWQATIRKKAAVVE
ncbi:MAG: sglT 8 [Verrucomicrobiales bacterium]|nr:sglT 8 [Verrucomicrobiales bacterium]